MKFDCEIIQDLLPLYIDDVCSTKSREMIEEHISECLKCKEQLGKLGNQTVTQELSKERNHVIEKHLKKEKKRSTVIGLITAATLMLPLIVCLICNLAVGHALDWFFIVLTSLMVFASLTVVPLLVNEKRFLVTISSFVISLVALLGTICIYTGGNWFYIAVIPSIAGLVICFMPFLIRQLPLSESLCNHKALLTMIVESVAVFSIVIAAGIYSKYPGYWKVATPITSYCLLIPWAIMIIMRYLPIPKMFRASIVSLVTGLLLAFLNDVVAVALGKFETINLAAADFTNWDVYSNNGNVAWCFIITGIIFTIVFAITGITMRTKNKEIKQEPTEEN